MVEKIYERMDQSVIAKQIGSTPNNWNGYSEEKKQVMYCRWCGFPMYVYGYRQNGRVCVWACSTKCCPNDMDSRLKFELNEFTLNNQGNTERQYIPFAPRKLP
jgi:hypothetical protein